jgi:hypothetical protein
MKAHIKMQRIKNKRGVEMQECISFKGAGTCGMFKQMREYSECSYYCPKEEEEEAEYEQFDEEVKNTEKDRKFAKLLSIKKDLEKEIEDKILKKKFCEIEGLEHRIKILDNIYKNFG